MGMHIEARLGSYNRVKRCLTHQTTNSIQYYTYDNSDRVSHVFRQAEATQRRVMRLSQSAAVIALSSL
jgi:hypothetical protein